MKPPTKIENYFYVQQYHYLYNEIQFTYYEPVGGINLVHT